MKAIYRIKSKIEFSNTINSLKCLKNHLYIVHINEDNHLGYGRVGIAVGSKNGNAVTRNRIKRQLRAVVDAVIEYSKVKFDIVVIPKKGFISDTYENKLKLFKELMKEYL